MVTDEHHDKRPLLAAGPGNCIKTHRFPPTPSPQSRAAKTFSARGPKFQHHCRRRACHGGSFQNPRPYVQTLRKHGPKPVNKSGEGRFELPKRTSPLLVFETSCVQPLCHLSELGLIVAPYRARVNGCPGATTILMVVRYAFGRPSISPTLAKISSGSLIRPVPTVRHACHPSSGPMN